MSGLVSGLMTLMLIIVFLGIVVWAYSKRNKETFETMANLPLEDDSDTPATTAKETPHE